MRLQRVIAGAAITTTALIMSVGPAAAQPQPRPTSATVVGTVKIDPQDPSVAWVLARYSCTIQDPENHPGHLWVSVKQNESRTVDPAISEEGSGWGGTAFAWEDSHRNDITCDGMTHTQRFSVDQVEDKDTYATLAKGEAWVQFCLFDDTTPQGNGETDFGQPVSSMVWAHVN